MRKLLLSAAVVMAVPLWLIAFREGPFPGMTGGFGEPSCQSCHLDNPVDAPGGALRVTGIPRSYSPGQTYAITIQLTRRDLRRGGFEIAARFATGAGRGQQAGSWRLPDARLQIVPSLDGTAEFVQHTAAGTVAEPPGELTWNVEWTAPGGREGAIEFNAAGNASNDDASPLGDFIYLTRQRTRAR